MRWLPDDQKIKGVLQIAHGITEHIGRYDAFARFMANSGFAVAGNSHLGHGQSASGERGMGFFARRGGWETAAEDLYLLHQTMRRQYPDTPYFLLGHSMGSFLSRTLLIRHPECLNGCILSGTGQQAPLLLLTGCAITRMACVFCGARQPSPRLNLLCKSVYNRRVLNRRSPGDWLTRNQESVDRFTADTACGFVPTAAMLRDLLGGIRYVGKMKNARKMRKDLPVLIISGIQDPVGDYGAGVRKVYRLFKKAGLRDVTMTLYDGARHEVLNETNREEVYNDVLQWMMGRIY